MWRTGASGPRHAEDILETVSGDWESKDMPRLYKGERDFLGVRTPKRLGMLVRERAKEEGLTVSDYVAMVLAEHENEPLPQGPLRDKSQGELPLTG